MCWKTVTLTGANSYVGVYHGSELSFVTLTSDQKELATLMNAYYASCQYSPSLCYPCICWSRIYCQQLSFRATPTMAMWPHGLPTLTTQKCSLGSRGPVLSSKRMTWEEPRRIFGEAFLRYSCTEKVWIMLNLFSHIHTEHIIALMPSIYSHLEHKCMSSYGQLEYWVITLICPPYVMSCRL